MSPGVHMAPVQFHVGGGDAPVSSVTTNPGATEIAVRAAVALWTLYIPRALVAASMRDPPGIVIGTRGFFTGFPKESVTTPEKLGVSLQLGEPLSVGLNRYEPNRVS
jgi:hypothetical protein